MKLLERELTLLQSEPTGAGADDAGNQPPPPSEEAVVGDRVEEVAGAQSAGAPAKTKRILVVDDEELVLRSLRRKSAPMPLYRSRTTARSFCSRPSGPSTTGWS